ncbi:MAG: tryptophan synthase subunit alpha [Magnetococcales bacterium]|nr:tryptophan synthase subunit alpha [Magnetococcales bacterium]NGZ07145.1 tryptophan synthase subunit alpha [Magnetococcales bacterium]
MSQLMPALEPYIRQRRAQREAHGQAPILLMSHLVLGYPSLAVNQETIAAMAAAGVELVELQIPFSEPIADGPVIAQANQLALDQGFRVEEGLEFAAACVQRHPEVAFLLMTYSNILMAYGVERFIERAAQMGIRGLIVPDWPPQEAGQPMALCQAQTALDWIQLFTPTSTDVRLQTIGRWARGFCYCVARKGVTGGRTDFDADLRHFLQRCRQVTDKPLAVGFGVRTSADVQTLTPLAEIAVVGTAALEIQRTAGAVAVGAFFQKLRG